MGHTVYPMRWIVYEKMEQLRKISKGLREKERKIADELINGIFQDISAVNYANPQPNEIENTLIFTMLLQEKKKLGSECGIDDLTVRVFAEIIRHKAEMEGKKEKNES